MLIKKDEIEKYIFDPDNPKLCKSYNLLLNIAKKDNYSFFSPEFLQYFFGEQVLNDDFKNELWDIPDDYDSLTFNEKVNLFKNQLSKNDLDDIEYNINTDKIEKYSFFKKLSTINERLTEVSDVYGYDIEEDFKEYILKNIFENDNIFLNEYQFNNKEYNQRYIFFSKYFLKPLSSNITRTSIMITMEENIDKFLKYEQENIKPIFLKKIEDVDLLLDVLQNDIDKPKDKNIIKEDINTINSISISNFFSIKDLKIDNLENKKEIYIVGENGDGKTLFLQAIACALKGVEEDGQGSFRNIKNDFKLEIVDSLNNSFKCDKNHTYKNFLAYGAMRNNNCNNIEDKTGFLTLFNSAVDLENPIKWLIRLDHSEKKEEKNFISVAQAKQLIKNILNGEVDNIDITSKEVIFKEKGSPVEFDRLSAGYKGSITILCDILIRLSENQPYITDITKYRGIVLIDEVELHLHPRWEYEFMQKLRGFFPLVQFIVTTHSPTVILGASKEAIFFNIYKDDNGNVCISNQKPIKDNFLNEIQSNIFNFDINKQRITYPREEDKKQNQKARKSLLELIDMIEKDK
jgi:predicted ATPase